MESSDSNHSNESIRSNRIRQETWQSRKGEKMP